MAGELNPEQTMRDLHAPGAAVFNDRKTVRSRLAILSGIFLVSLFSRLPLIVHPPTDFYYNHDELAVSFVALDRFLGLPPTLLMLPASSLQFFYLPLFLADVVIRRGLPHSPAGFLGELSLQLSQSYLDPRHAVTLMRCLVAVITSAAPVLAYCLVETCGASMGAALLGAALVLANPVFLQQSVMAGADAVAPTLALASTLCLLKTKWGRNFQYAGFLLAAGLASRITIGGFASIPILYLLIGDGTTAWKERRKAAIQFCVGLILGFLFWCPYVWTDPVRMAKAVYGNLNRPESYFDLAAFARAWWLGMGPGFCWAWVALFAAGCWVAFRYRPAMGLAAIAGSILMCVPLALRSSTAVPRYFLPLVPCLIILLMVVAGQPQVCPLVRNSVLGLIVLSVVMMAADCVVRERALREPDDLNAALRFIPALPGQGITEIYLPNWLMTEARIQLPRAACERLLAKTADLAGVVGFAESRGISANAAATLVTDFNEKEQAEAAHLAIACRNAPDGSQRVFLYYDPDDYGISRLLADMSLQQALEHVRTQPDSAIFVEGVHLPWATRMWVGEGDWLWYKGPETHP